MSPIETLKITTRSLRDTFTQLKRPCPQFTEHNLPSLVSKVYLITGGSAGVGFELCKLLYAKSATIYLAGRSPVNAAAAIQTIQDEYPDSKGSLNFLQLDLADLESIKESARRFLEQVERLDVVWHNAGVAYPHVGKTKQGHEEMLATNAIGPWLLQQFLTPLLQATAALPDTKPNSVRVVWVSSSGHSQSPLNGGILWDDINFDTAYQGRGLEARMTMNGAFIKYGQSKAASIILSREASKRWEGTGVISVSVHPGVLKTKLTLSNPPFITACLKPIMRPAYFGAVTELYAGLAPGDKFNGEYVVPWGKIGKPRADVQRMLPENGERLWRWCEVQCREFM